MILRQVAATLWIITFLVQTAAADVIVTSKGERHSGVIADRERLADNPQRAEAVSILVTDTPSGLPDMLRIATVDIEYVVLDDSGARRVFDLQNPIGPRPSIPASKEVGVTQGADRIRSVPSTVGATVVMVIGAAVASIGASLKLGGIETRHTGTNTVYEERGYDVRNYILIAVGTAMFLGGAVRLGVTSRKEHENAIAASCPEVFWGYCASF